MEAVKNMMWLESIEPRFTALFFKVIEFCLSPKTYEELSREIMAYPEMATPVQSAETILEWLEECGALRVTSETDEPEAVRRWHSTSEGKEYLKSRESKLDKVKTENGKLINEILAFCRSGKRLSELEQAFPAKENGPKVSYYILELERAGSLEWRDGWTTTG